MRPRIHLRTLARASALFLFLIPSIPEGTADTGQDLTSRPGPRGEPITIQIFCALTDIRDVIDVDQSIEASLAFSLSWHDPRLAHGNEDPVKQLLDQIWDPGIVVLNADEVDVENNERVDVLPDGTVVLMTFVRGTFFQTFDLRNFPFDQQEFAVEFVSVSHPPSELVIVPHPERVARETRRRGRESNAFSMFTLLHQ